jgi:pimeloyl-ACP methyl ester carboxylesterase
MPHPRAPLVLATFGHRFAGGTHTDREHVMTGQIYAEYYVPQPCTQPYPVVMIEGGFQTGANFTATPDGREGWAQFFVRAGYTVYVVDQPGRGRSSYDEGAYGPSRPPTLDFILRRFAAPERYNEWPQAHLHTQWPGTGEPGDPAFDQFVAQEVPSIADYALQQRLNTAALVALLDDIGPAILLTHSQSGPFGWAVADARPELVRAILAVEPNGPPVHDVINLGPPDWFADDPAVKPYGLTLVPLTYDPAPADASDLHFVRADAPPRPGCARGWLQREPARRLINLARVPILMVEGEASYHAAFDACTSAYLTQAGVAHTYLRLIDHGIRGNGHMLMLERNSDEIAAVMLAWLRNLPPRDTP